MTLTNASSIQLTDKWQSIRSSMYFVVVAICFKVDNVEFDMI